MEQLGQSQVFPYLRRLANGRRITLITYEKEQDLNDSERKDRFSRIAQNAGIHWLPLRYHKSPGLLAKAYDMTIGFIMGAVKCITGKIRIVHARGYIVSIVALALKQFFGVRFIFDMRGFWVDQRVEMGLWREGSLIYRIAKWLESRFLQKADVVFALSAAAVEEMKKWPAVKGRSIKFEVVTTCTDLDLFRPPPGGVKFNPDKPFTVGYIGSAGQGYLFEPVLDLYLEIRNIQLDARLKIVNKKDHALINERLNARGIPRESVELLGCDYSEVHKNIWGMDIGIFFYKWNKTHVSSVPTRMGEFLACGVPCLSNVSGAGIIDILEKEKVGVVLRNFDTESIKEAASAAVKTATKDECRTRCTESAKRHFSLDAGVAIYEKVYKDLEKEVS
jgi:glycosyltransferase involved in cell wall biosynthesis